MAAVIDYEARLSKVQTAIDAILTGGHSEYEIEGQRVTKLDLESLQAEEQRLIGRINRLARRGGAFTRVVPR